MDTAPPAPAPPEGGSSPVDGTFLDHLSSAADLVSGRRFSEAEAQALRALSRSPDDPRVLKLLALVRFKLGRLEEAREVCRRIVRVLPDDAGVRMKLGMIALKMGILDEAVEALEESARLAPDDVRVWSYLGFTYARRGERTRAAAAFRRAGQGEHAIEVESGRAPADVSTGDTPPGGIGRAAGGDGGGGLAAGLPSPVAAARQVAPELSAAAGSLPAATLESAFDPGEPRTDPDRFLGTAFSGDGSGSVPVAPLIGYAVSRLAPAADQAAWVGATARLPIGDEVFVRADAAVACAGNAHWELAERRVRGRATGQPLGGTPADAAQPGPDGGQAGPGGRAGQPFFRVTGRGEIFVGATVGRLVPLLLEDDILYVREDRVLAFEGTVPWEYGHVPRGGIRMLQFRGRGLVAIRVDGEPGAVKVTPERPLFVSPPHLLGWIGRVVAHGIADAFAGAAGGPGTPFGIACEGEGVVLMDVRGPARADGPAVGWRANENRDRS